MASSTSLLRPLRLLVAGDLHGTWGPEDRRVIDLLRPDALLFVGDLGDEDPEIVGRVLEDAPNALFILGNHDAGRGIRDGDSPRLTEILSLLGERHLAYRTHALSADFALLGARPYSCGGRWSRGRRLVESHYGVADEQQSADRILQVAAEAPEPHLVILAHNGPTGLGSDRAAPFGRDFRLPAEDFGDPDLASAHHQLTNLGRSVPLILAGHMHEALAGGGRRRRVGRLGSTLVLNVAVVPRRQRIAARMATHFVELVLAPGAPVRARDLWFATDGSLLSSRVLA